MDKEDKILISAYLDGDTSELEGKQVEDLLANDIEALEYANSLKRANIEINNYFKGDEISRLNKSVDQFISSQIKKESSSPSQNGFLSKLGLTGLAELLSQTKAIGALAASIVLGLLVIPMVFQNEFDDPNIKIFEVNKLRSSTQNITDDAVLKLVIEEMIRLDIDTSILKNNESEIFIKIDLTNLSSKNCFMITTSQNGNKSKNEYCPD